jgi:predicted glycosyltransferase involved in capsule biosynthesis
MNDIFEDLFKQDKTQTQSISVVMCVMDRSDNLHKAIRSCLKHPDITEIIVLDYGSKTPFQTEYDSQKIKIYRIESPYWHLSKAYNIAIQLAKSDIIVKLDADYLLLDNFFEYHNIKEKEYVSGFGQYDSLCGFLMIHKKDFLSINGYNERIVTYGYDDDDLNQRLQKNNLIHKKLNRTYIQHLEHNKTPKEWFKNSPQPQISREESIRKNKSISNKNPWTTKDKMSRYATTSAFVCCMNRVDNLQKCIISWLDTKYFDEIIVLDYGSENILKLDTIESPLIKIYREETKYWHLSRAYNIAAQLTNGKVIVKLDSDYFVHKNFFNQNILDLNRPQFLTGNGCLTQSLWGFLMLQRKHFFDVNGYNERVIGWGHDDVDINQRLQNIGINKKTININNIKHLPHHENKNLYCQENVNIYETRKKNIQTIKNFPWTNKDSMSKLDQY